MVALDLTGDHSLILTGDHSLISTITIEREQESFNSKNNFRIRLDGLMGLISVAIFLFIKGYSIFMKYFLISERLFILVTIK